METPESESPKPKWVNYLLLSLLMVTTIGFLPLENFLLIEIRTPIIAWLIHFPGALTAMLLFLSLLLFTQMRYSQKWLGFKMMLLSFLLFPVMVIWLVFIWFIPALSWEDRVYYKNGDKYLIIQSAYDGDMPIWRVAEASSINNIVRKLEGVADTESVSQDSFGHYAVNVAYFGKVWQLVKTVGE